MMTCLAGSSLSRTRKAPVLVSPGAFAFLRDARKLSTLAFWADGSDLLPRNAPCFELDSVLVKRCPKARPAGSGIFWGLAQDGGGGRSCWGTRCCTLRHIEKNSD